MNLWPALILLVNFVTLLQCQTVNDVKNDLMERFKADPMELDQNWEIAIRQVLFDSNSSVNQTNSQFDLDSSTSFSYSSSSVSNESTITDATSVDNRFSNLNQNLSISAEKSAQNAEIEDDLDDYDDEKKPSEMKKFESDIKKTKEKLPEAKKEEEDYDYVTENSAQASRQQMISDLALNLINNNELAEQLNMSRFAGLDEQGQITAIWVALLNLIESNNAQMMRALTPIGMDIFYKAKNLSANCSSALRQLIDALREQKSWALRMLDSIGRFPIGMSSGTVSSFGNYDQCLDIQTNVIISEDEDTVQGKYCLLELRMPPIPSIKPGVQQSLSENPINLTGTKYDRDQSPDIYQMVRRAAIGAYSTNFYNAICIPSSCSAEEIQEIVDIVFGIHDLTPKLGSCQTKYDQVVFSMNRTKFEYWCRRIFVDSFSMQKNFQKLISLEETNVHLVDLSFVNGIRVFLMLWIIMAHVFSVGTLPIPEIIYRFEDELRPFVRSFWMQWIYNGFGSVHAFFFISGFVLSFISIRNRKVFKAPCDPMTIVTKRQNGETESSIHSDKLKTAASQINSSLSANQALIHIPEFTSYAFERYFQFVIPMIGAFCFNFIWPQLGSGPFFHKVSAKMLHTCENNWWRNLFLINNFDKTNDICMVHTWFLSASFQLHLLAYPVILLLARCPKKAITLLVVLILLGIVVPGYLVYKNNINPTLNALVQVSTEQFYQELALVYYPFYNYLSCYFLGFLLGYLLLVRMHRRFYGSNSSSHYNVHLYSMKNVDQNNCHYHYQHDKRQFDVDQSSTTTAATATTTIKSANQSLFQKSFLFTVSILVTAINLFATFSTYYWTKDDQPKNNVLLNAAYRAFYPVCFIVAQIWLTIACIYYPNNILNRFLSLGFFQVMSRISFSVYMVHLFVVWYFFLQTRQLIRFTFQNLTFFTGGVLLYTIFVAVIFELLFISPFKSFNSIQRSRLRRQRELQRERKQQKIVGLK